MGREIYHWSVAAAIAALMLPAPAAAKEPLRLKPSSKWNVHYAEDSCRMGRSFGEGDQKVTMIIDRYQPGDDLKVSFIGKPADAYAVQSEAQLRFGPNEEWQGVPFFPGTLADKTPTLILRNTLRIAPRAEAEVDAYQAAVEAGTDDRFTWSTISPEREAAVTFVEVKRAVRRPFILETGSMGAPFAALRKCNDELLAHWGIDVARHATRSRTVVPKEKPSRWLRSADYPIRLLAEGKRAIVHFRLTVDETGKPTDCNIQQSTRPKGFDEAVCKGLMKRASFEPALDAEGKPLASYYISTVIFLI
jgi:TonB family protein